MYSVLKHTVIASAAAGLLSVVVLSGKSVRPDPSKNTSYTPIAPYVMPVDTPPPVNNEDLPFPIKENEPGEPIYNANQPLQLNSPSNIKTTTTYNPSDSSFNFTQKVGDMDYRPPISMTQEEYQDYLFKQQVKSYWKSRVQADAKSNPAKTSLIPKLTVNSELFDRLFGGSTVDIRPTGSAELIFGFITNRNQNPAIPVKQRKITNFDFNMKIQLNLVGKIGEKLKLTTNYNTEASFDFENQMKLEYNGLEDEIIKKVEAGNVSLPLNNSLITGSQTLFGLKTQLQFGKLMVTALLSQQRGKKTELTVQGGSQTIPFTVTADNYEANRHYFLGQFFRDNYNSWINVPIISSPIQITKIEVYVTNRTNQVDQARNIAAFADLGEDSSHVYYDNKHIPTPWSNLSVTDSAGHLPYPRNYANNLYQNLVDTTGGYLGILKNRDYNTAVHDLVQYTYNNNQGGQSQVFNAGREFEVLTRARRLNPLTDYTLNNRLGYISLNTSLNYDEVLSVAYQYTLNGKVYQVGEFSDQFPTGDKLIILKMLKSTQLNTHIPMWDLMMKNVYSLGAYSLSPTNFQLSVLYNNIKTGVDIPYIPYGTLDGEVLIKVMNLDKINQNQDPHPDGYFDFVPNITVNVQNGRIYFTEIEPFGNDLRRKFNFNPGYDDPTIAETYVFQELYDSTRVIAQQLPQKNRFKLKGNYQSATSNEFSLNSMNIPQGSVRVTAGGVPLTENVDYTVDYTLGRVKIINESILNSGQPIKISAENNSLFMIQQKSLIGTRLDYKVNKDFSLGSTLLHMTERPLTQKVNIGDEPVSNTVVGLDYSYRHDAPWLTRLIDKIPGLSTKEASSIQMAGEYAQLFPGHSKAIGKSGNSYVDDFEGSVSLIDVRSPTAWFHSSIPQGQPALFPEANPPLDGGVRSGDKRSNMAWYTIDQSVFYQQSSGLTPASITKTVQSNHFMQAFFESDLFPKKTPPNGQPVLLPSLDLAYYPSERGPYNFDSTHIDVQKSNAAGKVIFDDPQKRWAGIMRRLETNDFQSANIEYIQFWMMDPFNEDYNNTLQTQYNTFGVAPPTTGELYINLGSVSEDILKDGNMAYENGVPFNNTNQGILGTSAWGYYPTVPPLANAFDNNEDARPVQDVGYDCLSDAQEKSFYSSYTNYLTSLGIGGNNEGITDPSGDNYHFYRGDDYDNANMNTLKRYKKYNGVEGNSATQKQYQSQNGGGYPTTATTIPNIEDINRDNTMNQSEAYYQYKIKVTPADINPTNIGNNYIVNVIPVTKTMPDGSQRSINFYQFKIPVTDYDSKIGTIEGYNSIRFMRMFVRNFTDPVIMRFARLELVRSDWRNYQQDLSEATNQLGTDDATLFDVSAVSYQENGTREPVHYVLPPGINQQQNVQTTNLVLLNEQALSMRVCGLKDGDARAIYKNVNYDVRSYKKLKMFVHAEKLNNQPLNNGETQLFLRIGTDFTNNYYEYIVPLQLTPPGNYDNASDADRAKVWLDANSVEIDFAELTAQKLKRGVGSTGASPLETLSNGHMIRVVGNPNIATLTNIMVGVRNPVSLNDPSDKCVEVWINELRLTDFDQKGGWAANSRITAKLADFGQLSLSGAVSTPFYGSIEKKPSERSRELTEQYDFSTTLQMGKFLPKDWKVNFPMYLNYAEQYITPQYDPSNPDVLMSAVTTDNNFSQSEIDIIKNRAIDYTRRRGINFTNVSKQRSKNKTKQHLWDIENFSATYAFNEQYKHNITTAWSYNRQYNASLNYNFQKQVKAIEPFKNSKAKILQSPWLALIKDLNFTPMPNQFNFSTNVARSYIEVRNRDITALPGYDFTQTLYNKTFNISRVYATRWDLTKNIKADFTANNDGRVMEPTFEKIQTKAQRDFIADNLMKGGLNTAYRHTMNLNVNVPLNKIPILDFVSSATYKYTASYQWQRRPFANDSIGNTLNNNRQQNINMTFNMTSLYNKIPYFKRINTGQLKKDQPKTNNNQPKGGKGGGKGDVKNGTVDPNKPAPKDTTKKDPPEIFEYLARLVMTLKQASFTFNQTEGTTLPGYRDSTYILGMHPGHNFAPGPGFVFGQQNHLDNFFDPRDSLLVKRQNFSTPYAHTSQKTFSYQAKLEPFKNFKIDLTGTRTEGANDGFFIGWNGSDYQKLTQTRTGQFSISVITIGSAFAKDDKYTHNSTLFDNFMNKRGDYAVKLSNLNGNSLKSGHDGYSLNQQDVVVLSFLDAYANKKSSGLNQSSLFPKIPMPNWTINYDGLGKLEFLKPIFKSIVVSHGYRSTMSLGNFTNNQSFGAGVDDNNFFSGSRNPNNDFVAKYVINTVSITESFAPLIKFNMNFVDKGKLKGLGANVELKRDRSITLSSNVPQVMEMKGNELNIGSSYTFPNLEIKRLKIQGKPLKSDLQMNVTLSIRQNVTALHKINVDPLTGGEYQYSQPTNGQNVIAIKTSFTYTLSQNINIRIFYDRTINKPVISTSFPTQTTNAGVSLRFVIQ